MLQYSRDVANMEDAKLSSLAVLYSRSGGRIHPEESHPYRLDFQRDRDRIVHSSAFKRLQYKTQVFLYSIGENYRNRLTHTLEVAGIARTVATALGLNPLLSECIALAHDLGHTPFGHAGQDRLGELMKGYGGFEHNKQSLRIVEKLENRYPDFRGLNLTRETLKGLMKHGASYGDSLVQKERKESGASLESMVADIADEIAYNHHDIEDGLEMGYLEPESLTELQLWKEIQFQTDQEFSNLQNKVRVRTILRRIFNTLVTDLIESSARNLEELNLQTNSDWENAWKKGERPIRFSDSLRPKVYELKSFLHKNLYKTPSVVEMSSKGQDMIEKLFAHYIQNPNQIPDTYQGILSEEGEHRAVCDFVAGMTDRYAEKLYNQLFY